MDNSELATKPKQSQTDEPVNHDDAVEQANWSKVKKPSPAQRILQRQKTRNKILMAKRRGASFTPASDNVNSNTTEEDLIQLGMATPDASTMKNYTALVNEVKSFDKMIDASIVVVVGNFIRSFRESFGKMEDPKDYISKEINEKLTGYVNQLDSSFTAVYANYRGLMDEVITLSENKNPNIADVAIISAKFSKAVEISKSMEKHVDVTVDLITMIQELSKGACEYKELLDRNVVSDLEVKEN